MEGDDHGEAYTAIVWGGLLSRESSNIAEAEAFSVAEGNMCGGDGIPPPASLIFGHGPTIILFWQMKGLEQAARSRGQRPKRRHTEPRYPPLRIER